MAIIDYYIILISVVVLGMVIQVGYEVRQNVKFKDRGKCSYCEQHLTETFGMSFPFVGAPTIFKCRRWWCNLLKHLGYLKVK